MFKKFIFRHLLILMTLPIVSSAFAGWEDSPPVAVNHGSAPGQVNPHTNGGGRRIVRIEETVIVLCADQQGEKTYRSVNNGATWNEIDLNPGFSGTLITGPDMMVYHFIIHGDRLSMIKFRYQDTPPSPQIVYQNSALEETATGEYRSANATVNAQGTLFIATHWGNPDQIYLFVSENQGDSWRGPYQISSGNNLWYYPHLEVTPENRLVCVYDNLIFGEHDVYFASSADSGISWTRQLISHEQTQNSSILTVTDDLLLLFAQSSEPSHQGLVVNRSDDGGQTWRGWQLIDPTCGYADPSSGLGSDGRSIYVAYRSSNGTGVSTGSCGNQCRSRMVMSPDLGQSWQFVDNYYHAARTGTRSQVRYQTWWNYGGPLEWTWMQYASSGSQRFTYRDINTDVTIYKQSTTDSNPTSTPGGSGSDSTGSSGNDSTDSSENNPTGNSGSDSKCFINTIQNN